MGARSETHLPAAGEFVAALDDSPPARRHRARLPIVASIATVVIAAAGWLTLFEAALTAASSSWSLA